MGRDDVVCACKALIAYPRMNAHVGAPVSTRSIPKRGGLINPRSADQSWTWGVYLKNGVKLYDNGLVKVKFHGLAYSTAGMLQNIQSLYSIDYMAHPGVTPGHTRILSTCGQMSLDHTMKHDRGRCTTLCCR